MAQTEVRELVDSFVAKLETLIRDEIRRGFEAALGGTAPQASRPRPAPRATTTSPRPSAPAKFASAGRKKGQKRSPEELKALEDALLAHIRENTGKRIEEINRVLKVPTKDLARPISKLLAAKKIKTTGQKRATRYFPTGK